MLLHGVSPAASLLWGPPRGSCLVSWPLVSFQDCSSHSTKQSACREQRDFTPLHCVRRRGKMGQQHEKEVQREEKIPEWSGLDTERAPYPFVPSLLSITPFLQPKCAGCEQHHTRLPSGSPFPNLMKEADLKAFLHSVQVQKTLASPRGGAQGVATLITERDAAPSICSIKWKPALGGKKEERSWEISLPLSLNPIHKLARHTNG